MYNFQEKYSQLLLFYTVMIWKKPDFKTIRKRIICIDEYKHDGTHCILYYINKWIIRYLINLFIYSYIYSYIIRLLWRNHLPNCQLKPLCITSLFITCKFDGLTMEALYHNSSRMINIWVVYNYKKISYLNTFF